MRAIVRHRYGLPDVLALEEVPVPVPAADEVLVRVHATALNAADWEILRAKPSYVRFVGFGLFRPRITTLGSDIAGRIEAVGRDVSRFAPGEEVVGDTFRHGLGGLAEYVCLSEDAPLVAKPPGLSFEDAASLPQAGVIALQGLRDELEVRRGQHVAINGAGGGAGTLAVQLARSMGAIVTAVDGGDKLDRLRTLGADHVVDYRQQDFTETPERYDHILDMVGSHPLRHHQRALKPGGRYAMVGGSVPRILEALLLGSWISATDSRAMGILAVQSGSEDLLHLTAMVEAGTLRPVIDSRYPLERAGEALQRLGDGRALGKIIIRM